MDQNREADEAAGTSSSFYGMSAASNDTASTETPQQEASALPSDPTQPFVTVYPSLEDHLMQPPKLTVDFLRTVPLDTLFFCFYMVNTRAHEFAHVILQERGWKYEAQTNVWYIRNEAQGTAGQGLIYVFNDKNWTIEAVQNFQL